MSFLADYYDLKFWLRLLCSHCFLQIFSSKGRHCHYIYFQVTWILISLSKNLYRKQYKLYRFWLSKMSNVKRSYGILYLWDKYPSLSAQWETRRNLCSQKLFLFDLLLSIHSDERIKSTDFCQVWQMGFKLPSIYDSADNNCYFYGQHHNDMFSSHFQWITAIFWSFAVHSVSESVAVIFFLTSAS